MNKKGFTLVELLAVIVILAIIALISTPIILGVIDKAKKGAAEQSSLGYIDAVEKQIAIDQMNTTNTSIWKDGTYTKLNEEPLLRVKVKGTVPNGVSVTITNKKVESATLIVGDYKVVVGKNGKVTKVEATDEKPDDSTVSGPTMTIASKTDTHKGIVYLDPTDLSKTCNASNSVSTTGTKEGCMKWYIFDDSGNNYTMILDHNTTALVIYNSTKSNSEMKEAAIALSNDTANWNSSLNARLITANEIAKITGNTSFSGATSTSSNWFYLDSNNQTRTATSKGTSKYAWLFDYTNKCASYGCNIDDSSNNGYWTSTPVADSSSYAWTVYWNGSLNIYYVSSNGFGIRPVITISKSVIS